MSVSGIGSYDSSAYTDGLTSSTPSSSSSSDSTTGTSSSTTNYGQIADTVQLQGDSNLIQSLYPQSTSSATATSGYPTNIQQAAQEQAILYNNPNLAQQLSQAASSPQLAALSEPVQILQAMDNSSDINSSLISSAVSSMATLQEVDKAGTLKTNPALVQSLLPSYLSGLNLTNSSSTTGTKVDTTA
jgi:hypothetical protein